MNTKLDSKIKMTAQEKQDIESVRTSMLIMNLLFGKLHYSDIIAYCLNKGYLYRYSKTPRVKKPRKQRRNLYKLGLKNKFLL